MFGVSADIVLQPQAVLTGANGTPLKTGTLPPPARTARELLEQAAANGVSRDEAVRRAWAWLKDHPAVAVIELLLKEPQRQRAQGPRRGKLTVQAYELAVLQARTAGQRGWRKRLAALLGVTLQAVRDFEKKKLAKLAG
jgi:hypothetical protein